MHRCKILFLIILTTACFADKNGQFSTNGDIFKKSDGYFSQTGFRYLPNWSLTVPWPTAIFDAEISFDLNSSRKHRHGGESATAINFNLYRLWIRRTTADFEMRFGLQDIRFGPAQLLRSLGWFDQLKPTDLLQISDGVWGLQAYCVFANRSNLLLWGLLWNNEPKGWETIPTKKNNIEFGGRLQMPLWKGNIGFSGHNRIISSNDLPGHLETNTMPKATPEVRAAIDGKFDIGIGLWFESAILHADYGAISSHWQSFITIGAEYTFTVGNGLTVTAEHFHFNHNDSPFFANNDTQLSAIKAAYPISLMDQFMGIFYYSWDSDLPYFFLNWQRTYDNWTFNFNSFFSSKSVTVFNLNKSIPDFSTRGVQLMLILNH